MAKQGYADRMDESLGMRRGKESGKSQSYKSRRDESMGAFKGGYKGAKGFDIPDGRQSGEVRYVPTDSEQMDLGRIKPYSCGSRGYPSEAWNYQW